jgi:ferric-dicitrate binding protein FerR (iron transport regulator)
MDCRQAQNHLPAYQSGDLAAETAEAVGAHVATCEACKAEARDTQSVLSLLDSLPDISPAPTVWENVSNAIDRDAVPATRSRGRSFSMILRIAAAASLLVAAVSFMYVALASRAPVATVSAVLPGSDAIPGTTLRAGDSFTATAYTTLTLPGVGAVKLNKGTRVTFETARRVRLESGELFAEIIPGGKGFRVVNRDTTVTVHGTRFGVRDDGTVYVVEGRVSVLSSGSATELSGQQMAKAGGPAQVLRDEALRWIATHEAPTITLQLDRVDRTITRGGPVTFRLALRSSSPAPVYLETPRDLAAHITLKVTDPAGTEYLANLGECASLAHARPGTDGRTRVDVATPVLLDARVLIKDGFERLGRYTIQLSYDGSRTPERLGTVIPSDPCTIEVRD